MCQINCMILTVLFFKNLNLQKADGIGPVLPMSQMHNKDSRTLAECESKIESLPPATKLGQGYVFTGVCDSVHRGGVCLSACWDATPPPPEQTPPGQVHPPGADPPGADTPPGPGTPLPRACWEIRSTSGHPTGMQSCFFDVYLQYYEKFIENSGLRLDSGSL